ncbi:response regulator [Corallococcus caeni]|uniref:response regulator n=1 Tax=Corallococcus caeni TaxID=3082388 RepID=UPI0030C76DE7
MPTRMLIVEDEASLRWALNRYFTLRGYEVICAENIAEALETVSVAKTPFHVVLTDLHFEGRSCEDGLELVKCLKPLMPQLRFILLTASLEEDLRERARTAGVDVALVKPQRLPTLESYIAAFTSPAQLSAPESMPAAS